MGKIRRILGFLSFFAVVFLGANSFAASTDSCQPGLYYNASTQQLESCPAGYYCPEGEEYEDGQDTDACAIECPASFNQLNGNTGAVSIDDCTMQAIEAQYIKYSNGTFTVERFDSDYYYYTGGTLTYGQAMKDVANGVTTWFKYSCPLHSMNVSGAPFCYCDEGYTTTSTVQTLIAENAVGSDGSSCSNGRIYTIKIDYNTPIQCTDPDLCGDYEGQTAPAITDTAKQLPVDEFDIKTGDTLPEIGIEYQERPGYELVYYVGYPNQEDYLDIYLEPNSDEDEGVLIWTTSDPDTGEYVPTTVWSYSGDSTEITYYPMWRAKTITCEAGTYLLKSSEACTTCPAGSYCTGGTFTYSDTADQGIESCPAFPYNNSAAGTITKDLCYANCEDLENYYSAGSVPYWKNSRVEEHCTKESYVVTFKCKGTTISTTDVTYGGSFTTPTADACNISGYYVSEWSEAGSNVTGGAPGTSIDWNWTDEEIPDIVFNALLVPNTLTINYDAGDGSGSAPVTPTKCEYGGTACLAPQNTFTPPAGYVFSHWLVTDDGVAAGGYLGETFNTSADMSYMMNEFSLTITLKAVYEVSNETISCSQGSYLPAGGLTTSDCKTCETGSYCPGGAWTYNATTAQGITNCPYIFTMGDEGYGSADECMAIAIEGQYIAYDKNNTDAPFKIVKGTSTTSYYPTGSLTYGQALSDIENSALSTVRWLIESCPANSKNTDYSPYCLCNADYISSSDDATRASLNAVIKNETCVLNTITCSKGTYYNGTSKTCETCPVGSYCDEEVTVNKNSTTTTGLKSCIADAFTDGTTDNVTSGAGSTSITDCTITIPAGKQLASITGQIYDLESGWYSGGNSIINYSDTLHAVDNYATSCAGDMGDFYNKSDVGATSHLQCYGLLTLTKNDATGLLYNADGTVVDGDTTDADSVDYKCYVSDTATHNDCALPSTGTLSNPGWTINGWGTDSSCTVGDTTINTSGMTPQSAEVFACMKQDAVKIQCPAYGYLPAGATECDQCKTGYYCPETAVTYTYSESEDQGLTICTPGYYCPEADGKKYTCPMNFTSDEGTKSENDCYYELLPAQQFTYDRSGDIMDCDTTSGTSYCPGGIYTWFSVTVGSTGSLSCPTNSVTNTNTDGCVCNDGYTVDGLAGGRKDVTSIENGTCQAVQCVAGKYYVPSENEEYPCSEGYYCPGTGDAVSIYDSDANVSCDAACPEEFPNSDEGANRLGACYKTCPVGSPSNIATPDNPNACEEQQIYYVYFYCSEEDKNNKTNEATYYDVAFGGTVGMLPTSDTCTKTGYTLTKWACDEWGTYDAGTDNNVYSVAGSDYCAAVWEPNTLTINYDVGYGWLPDDAPTTCQYGDTTCLAPTPTAPDGYIFNGWTVQTTDGTKYFDAGDNLAELAANGDTTVTLTADYVKEMYYVPFYCDYTKATIITTQDVSFEGQLYGQPSYVAEERCGITDKQVMKYVCGNHEVYPEQTVTYSSTITDECFAQWETKPQTKVKCDPGYFLPAGSTSADDCELCRNTAYCEGNGEYDLNSSVDQGLTPCPDEYPVSDPGADDVGLCYNPYTEACTNPCGSASYCYTCPNDNFSSCAYDTTATVTVKDFYSGETELVGDETCPIKYSNLTMCKPTYYLDESAKDCSKLCTSLPGSCQNANGDSVQCWNMSTVATLSAGANACYGAGCTPTCNLFNDYVLGTDGKLTGEYVNHCPEHATCTESNSANEGYRWYPNTICTPTTFCSFTYTCDAGYVASTTGNIEYGYSRTLYGAPKTATTIAACDPGVFGVTLDANGGTGGTTTMYQKYTVGWYSDKSATNALTKITVPTKDRYTFAGYYLNGVEVVDVDGIVNPGASNLFTADGVITAQWTAKSIECGAGYYYDYDNMACAECTSPYYCPGGTFDMTVSDGDLGKKDCKIHAFPYYAIANADKVFSTTKADEITDCYITIPAGKQINANWGLEDLESGWYSLGTTLYYTTGSVPERDDYAIKCSVDMMLFTNETTPGATSHHQCYGTITLYKNEGTGSLNGEDANSSTATVTCSIETLENDAKCELPMTGITKKGATLAGWSVNYECTDNVSVEYLAGLIEKQLPLQLSACWESKKITCEPGYYFDYENQKCAECMSPYYCPGGTFDMDSENADGRVDCRIDAFPYYAGNIDASAIGSTRGAKAKTQCYVNLPAGKELISIDGQIADLRSGYFFTGGQLNWSAIVPDFTGYATKCSEDLGMTFYEHSNVGAKNHDECYGTITLNKKGATGLLYDQSDNVINGDSETAQSVEYKCYANGDDATFCSLPKTTGLSRDGWSIGGWDTVYGCTGAGQTQINLNNMTSGTNMYVCMARNSITCDAGTFLPTGAETCSECEIGHYCPGGTFQYSESDDKGLNQCPSIFTHGDAGTKSESECRAIAIEAQYIKYTNGAFQIAHDDSDTEYCTGGTLTYGQAMKDIAKGEDTWFVYQCPSNSLNTDGAPYCLCNADYTTSSDDAALIALNAVISGNMCIRNACDAGMYMSNNECITCPAGSVCSTDVPHNAPQTCSELTGGLYTMSAPGSSSIDACYKECEEYAITNGTAIPVEDTVFYPFECKFTGRSSTGNPCDIIDGVCIETSCNYNFELIDGICTPCARENAISYKQGGNCVVESCVSGFHPNGQACEADVTECSAPNALAASQKWDPKKNAFGECVITECADGYHLGSNACQRDEQVCELAHGIGMREWNHNTNKWGECIATECDPGYTNDSSLTNEGWEQCGRCNNMYSANGELAVSSYTKGCEIASCMYQGELYNLENNECRLICNTYSDETGSRKWNASRKKCEHSCAPGYVTW